jgi:hypothetical protein
VNPGRRKLGVDLIDMARASDVGCVGVRVQYLCGIEVGDFSSLDTQSEIGSKTKGAEMPDDSKPDQPSHEDTLRNLILLTLPWLSFQREMLEIAKDKITDPSHFKSTENFALRQLQALMMILDRSGTRRNLLDQNFEKRLGDAYKENLPKLTSASVQFIEAQEAILASVFDALNTLRKGDKAKSE